MRIRVAVRAFIFLMLARSAYADGEATFNNQVVRIFQQHCQTCHRPGNVAPFSLMSYADARPWARAIREAVLLKTMPPWKPVDAHGVFQGERSLTDQEIQTISDWVNNGAGEGAASDLPQPISFPETWSLGTPDITLQPSGSFAVPKGSDDIYRCFPMPVNSTSDVYVRGYEVIPGNRAIVHHVLLFTDERGDSEALDNADPEPGYTCFGGAGFFNGLGGVGGWVPGSSPEKFPLGTGVRIPKGSRVVMQVHYSLANFSQTSTAAPGPDLTRVGLYTSPVPLEEVTFLPVVNPFLSIPPGASHYKVTAVLPISRTVELISIAPHMHLLGREATIEAILPGKTEPLQLIRIADWNFQWQGDYLYREPIILPAGTIVQLTAYYDNSLNNPRNPTNPPVTVRWGERTVDEMALTFLTVKSPGVPTLNTVPFSMTDRSTNSVATQGSSGNLQVGYARVADSSGKAPSGLAIFSYRQNGALVSEAGVPASKLLSQGRMYAETSGAVHSGLAIANPNGDSSVVSFSFIDTDGRTVSTGSTTILANRQVAAFLDDPQIFNGPANFSGAFTFSASNPVAVVALRGVFNERSELIWTTLPVFEIGSPPAASSTVFPHFADGGGWTTQIMLVNPGDSAVTGTLRFSDPAGQALSTLNYSIPGRSAQQFPTGGSTAAVRTGTVTIVPAANAATPNGSLVFSYRKSNVRVTEAGVPVATAGNAFRVYVEASDSIQSGIALTNTAGTSASVRIDLMDLSGVSLGSTTLTLAGNAQLARFLTELPGFQSLSLPIQGLLRITSTSPIAVVGLRSRTNERGDFLTTTTPPVPESDSSASELFFPHFADADGYTTQFILFGNGASRSLSGTMRFFSQSGQPLGLQLR